jgi:hypothetical protein
MRVPMASGNNFGSHGPQAKMNCFARTVSPLALVIASSAAPGFGG